MSLGHGSTLAADRRSGPRAGSDRTDPERQRHLGQNGVVTSQQVPRVVLTGGIGSGKSVVGRLLARWGALVVDADQLAREVVAPGTPGLAAVVAEFGNEVLDDDGALDRAAMAEVVFHDPARLAALEAIVHPLVQRAAEARFAGAPAGTLQVYEVPVPDKRTPEAGEWTLVVLAPSDIRRQRLLARGLSDQQVTARMAQQPDDQGWRDLADRVIDNGGDLHSLAEQVRQVWQELTGREAPGAGDDLDVGGAD